MTRSDTNRRAQTAALRREAILNAALDEFLEKGFAAARIEDIARRARVAKGTIYLHFEDKEALFEAIVKQEIRPKIDHAATAALHAASLNVFLEQVILPILIDVVNTRRGAVLRMLIGEAGRFPRLAEVYFRVVVSPGLAALRSFIQRARENGELQDPLLAEFPQLLMAPMLLSVVWTGLFQKFEVLDVERMLRSYFIYMTSGPKAGAASPKDRS